MSQSFDALPESHHSSAISTMSPTHLALATFLLRGLLVG